MAHSRADVAVKGQVSGRDYCLQAVYRRCSQGENFGSLSTGKMRSGYKGSCFPRLIPGFMRQDDEFTCHNSTHSKSIYGENFSDENFTLNMSRHLVLGKCWTQPKWLCGLSAQLRLMGWMASMGSLAGREIARILWRPWAFQEWQDQQEDSRPFWEIWFCVLSYPHHSFCSCGEHLPALKSCYLCALTHCNPLDSIYPLSPSRFSWIQSLGVMK